MYSLIFLFVVLFHNFPLLFLLMVQIPQIRRQAIKELPQFATGDNLPRVADILTQLLQSGRRCTPGNVCSLFCFLLIILLQSSLSQWHPHPAVAPLPLFCLLSPYVVTTVNYFVNFLWTIIVNLFLPWTFFIQVLLKQERKINLQLQTALNYLLTKSYWISNPETLTKRWNAFFIQNI